MPFLGPLFWGAGRLGIGLRVIPQLGQRQRHRPAKSKENLRTENAAGAPLAPALATALGAAPAPSPVRPCAPASPRQPLARPSPAAELVWVLVREPNANRELENREPKAFWARRGGWRACPAYTTLRPLNPSLAHTGGYNRLWVEYRPTIPPALLPPDTAHSGCLAFPFPSLLHCLHRPYV